MKLWVIVLVAASWFAVTWQAVQVGQDEETIWTEAHRVAPLKPRPLVNLGTAYLGRLDEQGADLLYEAALDLALQRPPNEAAMTRTVVRENRRRMEIEWSTWLSDPS